MLLASRITFHKLERSLALFNHPTMLFLSALVSLLPLTALATPIATQPANVKAVADYPTISKVLNDIITQCKKLVATSARFTGDAVDAVPIVSMNHLGYEQPY